MSAQDSLISIDLITGFLGSGKTTFMKYYIHYLTQKETVAIIVNDFGAVNVDMMLLKELRSSKCEIEMVTAADIDCYKRRLKTKLISLKLQGFKHIIIEPSGIFDINLFLDIISDDPLDGWYHLNSVIGIVDASLDVSDKSMQHLLVDELLDSGILVYSKTQLVDHAQLNQVADYIKESFNDYDVNSNNYAVIKKDWHNLTQEDYALIENAGYKQHTITKDTHNHYKSLFFFNLSYTKYELTLKINKLFENQRIIRIKGFMTLQEGYLVSINATKEQLSIQPIKEGQEVIIVIGEEIDENYIKSVLS